MKLIKWSIETLQQNAIGSLAVGQNNLDQAATSLSSISDDLEYSNETKSVANSIRGIISSIMSTKSQIGGIVQTLQNVEKENAGIFEKLLYKNKDRVAEGIGDALGLLLNIKESDGKTNNYDSFYADKYGDFLYIPYYNQLDYGDIPYGRSTVKKGGCGITCIADELAYFGVYVTLEHLAKKYKGDKSSGGTGSEQMIQILEDYNLFESRCNWTEGWTDGKILEALENGQHVILKVGKGAFTENGHYIKLTGITEDGKLIVYDPNGENWDKMTEQFINGFNINTVKSCTMDCFILKKNDEVSPQDESYNKLKEQAEKELNDRESLKE